MPYGILKIDTITFTDGGVDKSVPVSGLVLNPTFTGNVTVTGTISGNIIQGGTTVSGLTVTGTTANFASGVFTTQISGVTITGTTVSTTTGNFTSLTGTTATITSGIIASGTAALPSLAILSDPNTGIYSPGADQLAVATNGTGRLFVDANGRVGVGVTPSTTFFHVYTDAPGTVSAPTICLEGGFNGYGAGINFASRTSSGGTLVSMAKITGDGEAAWNTTASTQDANLRFFTAENGSLGERLRITSAGLVGIGTSGPAFAVDISAPNDAIVRSRTNGNTSAGFIGSTNNGTNNWFLGSRKDSVGGSSGTDRFNLLYDTSAFLTVTSAGLVGIGTTSPGEKLHVIGNIQVGDSGNERGIYVGAAGFSGAFLYQPTGDVQLSPRSGFGIKFAPAPGSATEWGRWDSSGRLLVGTIASPAHQLQVSTDSAGKPSTNTWTIVSDERIKEEIELADLDLCYQAVKTIPLKRFKWKDEVYTEEQVKDRRKLGWIAQDVEAVFPKAVGTYEFKYNQVFEETIIPAVEEVLDDEGNVTTPAQPERIEKGELISEDVIEDCRDLNSDQLYAAMYGAIQKLMVKVETLETELAALKAS